MLRKFEDAIAVENEESPDVVADEVDFRPVNLSQIDMIIDEEERQEVGVLQSGGANELMMSFSRLLLSRFLEIF